MDPAEKIVEAICEASVDRTRMAAVGRALRHAIGADMLYAHTRSTRTGEPQEPFVLQGITDAALTTYAEHYWQSNPVTPYMLASPLDAICNLNTIVPDRRFQRSAVYHEWGLPNGFVRNLGWRGYVAREHVLSVTVARGSTKDFDATELALLERIAPHFSSSARLRHELERAREKATTLGALAASLQCAAFLLDEDGRVDTANDPARDLLREGSILRYEGSRLRASDRTVDSRLQRALRASPTNRVLYLEAAGPLSTLAFVLPRRDEDGARRPGCLLLVPPTHLDTGAVSEWLRGWHELTHAEATVAVAIAWGEAPDAIADGRGVSITTVRSQLRSLMQKLGVRRREELVDFIRRAAGPLGRFER